MEGFGRIMRWWVRLDRVGMLAAIEIVEDKENCKRFENSKERWLENVVIFVMRMA